MPTKSRISCLLAAVLLVAYTHCVYSHATEAADRHQQLRSDEQPLGGTRAACENESSCICKGATLAVDVKVSAPELSFVDTLCADSAVAVLGRLADASERRSLPDEGSSPMSGRILRAQLQSFLL